MRIPLNWLSEFVKLPKSQKDLTDKLTMAGHMLDKTDKVKGNVVIDLELRGNRADCYSVTGIAKEVSALFDTKVNFPKPLVKIKRVKNLTNINLKVQTHLVKRVMMVKIKDVKIAKSPKWLADRLSQYGMESINNIVDLTNYVMIETGEPLHAFDLDKLDGNLEIRLTQKGEEMITFQGKTLTLDEDDLVWAQGKDILSLAGAIGEKSHSISNTTKNILLEGANYDRANIRRSIHKHNLLTEAGIRHEKELDPNLVEAGIQRFIDLLQKNKWGLVSREVYDYYPRPVKPWKITLNYSYLNSLSGLKLDIKTVIKILKSLNFEVLKNTQETLEVTVPTQRTDVTLEEDLIEEILRIYGYDQIPTDTLSLAIPKVVTPNYITQELQIKSIMVGLGFNEVISSTFVRESYLKFNKPVGGKDEEEVKILNRPSPDNEFLRTTLFANLFESANKILNERGERVYLFEVGKIYFKDKTYKEPRKLGIIYHEKEAEFVHFKGYLESLFKKLNIKNTKYEEEPRGFSIKIGKEIIAYGFDHENIYYSEVDLDSILGKEENKKAALWPKYPPQIEDITLTFSGDTKIGNVVDLIKSEKMISDVELTDVYKNSYTFRVWYQDPNKTLTDKDVEKIRSRYLKEVAEKFGGTIKN